jgi:hypothetical protein
VAEKKNPWPGLTEAIGKADIVIIHGDGAMTGNGVIPRTMLFLAYLAKKHLATPVIIVNHTVDLEHPGLLRMAREVYPLFDDVVFRDPISVEKYKAICGGRYSADAAFLFEPAPRDTWIPLARRPTYFDVWPDTAGLDPSAPYLCVGGSSILGTIGDLAGVTAGYRRLIEHLSTIYPGQIVLTVSDLVDEPVFRDLATHFHTPLIGLHTPVQQVVDVLGNADAYIGGRWHPSIFALRGGTPIVPLSAKTNKMEALAGMVGISPPLPDALALETSVDAVGRQLLDCLERGAGLRSELRSWAEQNARDCIDNIAYLETL